MLQNKEAWLQQSKLAKMLCMGHREFGANRWRFLSKANTLYFRLCNICKFMMCIWIVNHQLNHMHPWCSWEGMLPGRYSPGKRCHTFWNRNIVLLPIVLGKIYMGRVHALIKSCWVGSRRERARDVTITTIGIPGIWNSRKSGIPVSLHILCKWSS